MIEDAVNKNETIPLEENSTYYIRTMVHFSFEQGVVLGYYNKMPDVSLMAAGKDQAVLLS